MSDIDDLLDRLIETYTVSTESFEEIRSYIQQLRDEIQRLEGQLEDRNQGIRNQQQKIEELRDEQRWIPVSERLPEAGSAVVATVDFEWYACCMYISYFPFIRTDWTDNNRDENPVTHWKLLQEPLKEKDHA